MNELKSYNQDMGELSANSWKAPSNMDYELWEEIGNTFQLWQGGVNWWVGDWLNEGEKLYGEKYAQAIETTGKSYQDLANCKWVADKVEFSTRVENLSWSHHREVAPLEPEEQADMLGWAVDNNASVHELKQEHRKRKNKLLAEGTPEIPEEKYRVIYADPPWQYEEHGATVSTGYGGTEWHYNSLSSEQIALLPIVKLAADNSVLFIWVTSPKLNEVWKIIEAWGFEYKTSFIWDKVKHNFGYYNSVRHEILLICGRGSSTPDMEITHLHDSVQVIERSDRHSEKPEQFRKIIDELYPYGKRIELFARVAAEGWDVWGNEADD